MNGLTKTFLVLLRLAIGWHFLFEGLEKVATYCPSAPRVNRTAYGEPLWGPTHPEAGAKPKSAARAWSSETYLRAARGPFAEYFLELAGDPLDRVEVLPRTEKEPNDRAHLRLPPGLEKDWRAYFDALVEHYHIEGKQLGRLEKALDQRKAVTVLWLEKGTTHVVRTTRFGNATIDQDVPVARLIREYKEKRAQLDNASSPRDQEELQSEGEKLRLELRAAADSQTDEMKKALDPVITSAQRAEHGPLPEPVVRHVGDWDRLDWIDFVTRWGLVVMGGCLLLGLFTRTACVAAALFLLSLYLSLPPFPWLPPNPRAEGHYLYVNKNLIELLALLALATTRSGRWLGLDALWPLLFGRPRTPGQVPAPERTVARIEKDAGVPRSPIPEPRTPIPPKESHGD
jgi:uncharacterized membrane protein YphA (DoxX/SURF4 family)